MKRKLEKIIDIPAIFTAICTVVFLTVFITVSYLDGIPSLKICIISCAIYFIFTFLGAYLIKKIVSRSLVSSKKGLFLSSVLSAVISDMSTPAVVFDEHEKIIKVNASFELGIENPSSYIGMTSKEFFSLTLEELLSRQAPTLVLGELTYKIELFKELGKGRTFYVALFHDITKELELQKELDDSKPLYGFIITDNIDEHFSATGADIRETKDRTEQIILEWAESYSGAMTVIGDGKYMILMRKKYLSELIQNDFDILKRVKEAKVGLSGHSVTISGGFASIDGTDEEIINAARSACEMAIQRGGDQIAYKESAEKIKYCGGTSKSTQSLTKIGIRVDANKLVNLIKTSSNVIIMGHTNPDYDSIASCVGLYRLAHFCSTRANIVIEFPTEDRLQFQNTINSFETLGESTEYRHAFVDKHEAAELMSENTLLILSDVSNSGKAQVPELILSAQKIAYVDHHQKDEEFLPTTVFKCIFTSASSASELVSGMLEAITPAGTLKENEATLMLAGMMLDTFNFTRNTHNGTFSAAQYLTREKASVDKASALLGTALPDYEKEHEFERNLRVYDGVAFAVKHTLGSDMDKIPCSRVADRLAALEGILISFALYEKESDDGKRAVICSVRSRGECVGINIGKIIGIFRAKLEESKTGEFITGGGDFEKGATITVNVPVATIQNLFKEAVFEFRKTL